MDMSNLLVNMTYNNLQLNSKQNKKTSNEQNSFLNLLNVVMQNKSDSNEMDSSTSNNDIINMFLNGNLNEQISMTDSNILSVDIINLMQAENQNDKSSNSTQTDFNNLMGMLLNVTQNINPEMQKLNSEVIINNSTQSIKQVSEIENLILSRKTGNNFSSSKEFNEFTSSSTNNSMEKSLVNNGFSKNVFTTKEWTKISQENDGSNQLLSKIVSGDFTSKLNSNLNSLNEEVVNQNDKVKNESKLNVDVDFRKSIVENKNVIFSNNNKIIEISDESAELKTNVLNQVKDKIVLMANDKEGTQEVNMELFPENLGKVNIKMSIEADKITVEIMALNEKTGNILLSNVQELTKVLQNNFSNGTVNVIVTENSLNQYNQSNLNYNQQQNNKEQNYKNQFLNNEITDLNEDNKITEMINLRNLKLNKVV